MWPFPQPVPLDLCYNPIMFTRHSLSLLAPSLGKLPLLFHLVGRFGECLLQNDGLSWPKFFFVSLQISSGNSHPEESLPFHTS